MPPVPAAGVPCNWPVPLPLSPKLTPLGNAPESDSAGSGKPDAATVKVPLLPAVNVVAFGVVKAGGWETVSVKFCVAEPTTLVAFSSTAETPPNDGVPEIVAVPSPLSWKLTPDGNDPVKVMAAVGWAGVVVTVNVPNVPAVKVT